MSAPRAAPPPDESREVASEGAATTGSVDEDCTAQRQLTDALTAMDKVKAGINHHQQSADAGLRRAARAELVTVTARISQPKRSLFTLSHVAVSAATSPFGPHVFRHRLPVRTELVQCETRKRPLPWHIFSAHCVMCTLALARCKEPYSTLAGRSTPHSDLTLSRSSLAVTMTPPGARPRGACVRCALVATPRPGPCCRCDSRGAASDRDVTVVPPLYLAAGHGPCLARLPVGWGEGPRPPRQLAMGGVLPQAAVHGPQACAL